MSEPASLPPTPPHVDGPPIGAHRVLKPSRNRWIAVAAIAAVFVAIGLFLIFTRGSWTGWLSALFFGFVLAVALAQLAGLGSRLTLDADTFELSTFGRKTVDRWDEVREFTPFRQSYNTLIGYDRVRDQDTRMGNLNRAMGGRTAAMPDTFGLTPENLVALLEAYRVNGLSRAWARHGDALDEIARAVRQEFEDSDGDYRIITDADDLRSVIADETITWPSIVVVDETGRHPDGRPKFALIVDILNPVTRWLPPAARERAALDDLGADEFRIIDPDSRTVTKLRRDA